MKNLKISQDKPFVIDVVRLKKAALVLKSFTNNNQKKTFKFLIDRESLSVTELTSKLKMERFMVSLCLLSLRKANLVTANRQGKGFYYKLNIDGFELVADAVKNYTNTVLEEED